MSLGPLGYFASLIRLCKALQAPVSDKKSKEPSQTEEIRVEWFGGDDVDVSVDIRLLVFIHDQRRDCANEEPLVGRSSPLSQGRHELESVHEGHEHVGEDDGEAESLDQI